VSRDTGGSGREKSQRIPRTLGEILVDKWVTPVEGINLEPTETRSTYASYETYLIDKLIDHQNRIEKINKKLTRNKKKLTLILAKLSELNNE